MTTKVLNIDLIVTDANTQSRLAINSETVEDYAELIDASEEWPFPPVVVFHDGSQYMVADGFHRVLGAAKTKRASIPCVVKKGTAHDARIFAMTANDQHGLRLTRADKRSCVVWLLDNVKGITQKDVAEKAGVTTRTVRNIVAERNEQKRKISAPPVGGTVEQPRDTGEDGRTDSDGTEPQESAPEPVRTATEKPGDSEPVRCPNCAGTRWEDGACVRCNQPEGEPAGEVDEDRIETQRKKTIKTVEALMRAFDDLHLLCPSEDELEDAIVSCKLLLAKIRRWK